MLISREIVVAPLSAEGTLMMTGLWLVLPRGLLHHVVLAPTHPFTPGLPTSETGSTRSAKTASPINSFYCSHLNEWIIFSVLNNLTSLFIFKHFLPAICPEQRVQELKQIYMYNPRKVCKIKLENEISRLISTHTVNWNDAFGDTI